MFFYLLLFLLFLYVKSFLDEDLGIESHDEKNSDVGGKNFTWNLG